MCQHETMGQDDARALAERLLAADLPQRWEHVQAVAAEAARLCTALHLDPSVVVAAAWLHDIGYAPSVAGTGFHPLDGARYLTGQGWDEALCGLVAHHTGAVTQADRLGLGDQLRAEFCDVAGLERDVLWTADATTGPAGQRMAIVDRVAEIVARYGPDDVVTECMVASRTSFEAAAARVAARMDGRGH
jgi:putative nucleotidyltransferase with HDIG domain